MKNLLLFSQFLLLVLIPLHLAYGQSIGGHVYIDYNSSGTYESTDKGIFSVKLYLYNKCDNGLVVDSTNTDIDGNYSFQGLNGDYTVKIDVNDPVYKNGNSFSQNCCFVINTQGQNEICNLGFAMPNCTSNPYSVDNLCDLAFDNPLLDLRKIGDFPCGQIPSVLGPWPGQPHCGGIYDNTSFFGFVAGSGDYSINITVFSCAGKGIQYGIIDACSPGGSLVVCSGEANTGLITIATNTLEPCKRYVLWLDGYEGSVCSYYVNVTGNFKICDPIIEENKPLAIGIDLNLVCDSTCNQNFGKVLKIVSNDSLPKIDKFDWLISNASTTIVQITTTPEIDISSLSPGQYDVCVRIDSSATYAETKYCKKITIESDYGVVKNTFTLCETELPWFGASDSLGNKLLDVFGTHWRWTKGPIIWSDLQIGKNTFINDHTDKCGCSYQQEIAVIYHVRGQACDDNDETTINDLVLDDCTCKGTRTSGITTNTTWYFRPFFVTPNNDVWQVKALRDTLIDQQIYKIVGLNRGNGFIKQTEIPLAQVGGRMYFYEDDERKLLYDFNAKVDQEVTYYVPKVQRLYDISSNGGFTAGADKAYRLRVEKIDTLVTSEGKILKLFKTSATERKEEFHHFNDIIEGVGSSFGLFGAFGPFLPSGTEGSIRCFQNEEGFYSILSDDCKLVHTLNIAKESSYTIYPNPSTDHIIIDGDHISLAELECRDISGKNIAVAYEFKNENLVMEIQHLPLGIYFVIIKVGHQTYPMRFVKVD